MTSSRQRPTDPDASPPTEKHALLGPIVFVPLLAVALFAIVLLVVLLGRP